MSKIPKNRFDKELRSSIGPLRLFGYLLSKKWGARVVRRLSLRHKGKNIEGLLCEERFVTSKNGGPDIRIRLFRPNIEATLPVMLYIHGGGYLVGVPEISLESIEAYIKKRPCVIVSPDYRKGLKEGYPNGFNDCYDTLLWIKKNATTLNVLSDKIVVAGHSAGGGLTAAVTLKSLDTGDVNIAFQMPFYPMIDHRQNTKSAREMDKGVPVWNTQSNALGWKTYLQFVNEEVSPYASAALATNYSHLPPTITYVGELDPFRDETINYVQALKKENIPTKFQVFEGSYHAFEKLVKKAEISQRATKFELESWAEYYDRYLK